MYQYETVLCMSLYYITQRKSSFFLPHNTNLKVVTYIATYQITLRIPTESLKSFLKIKK